MDIKSYPLLLLGEEWQIDKALKSYQGPLRELIHTFTYSAFKDLKIQNQLIEKCDFIILFYNEALSEEFFELIKEVKHKTEFILIVEEENFDFKKIINEWSVVKIVSFSDFNTSTWSGNIEILNKIEKKKERKVIIKKTTEQKKQLDELIIKQELSVSKKTSDIEYSNKEQDLKLKKERIILRFIKDISMISSDEELVRIIKNEFKVFHELGDIVLVKDCGDCKISILSTQYSFQWKDYLLKSNSINFNLHENSSELSSTMANFFGRPFGKVFISSLNHNCYLFFENQFNENSFFDFKEFFQDRDEIINMAYDKLFSELSLNQFSFRWEKTFDAIKEPIAIIDNNYNVLRSNLAFENNTQSLKCFELFAGLETVCPGCPLVETLEKNQPQRKDIILNKKNYQLFSYPMVTKTNLQSVVHTYRDRTQEKKLYSKLLQTEKMLSIGRLAGHLSHELNNPLTGIQSMVQVLKSQVPQATQNYSDLVEIEKATERCFKVLNNFMDFSNPKKVKLEPIDISEVVNKTIPLLKISLRNHLLKLNLNTKKKFILADPNMLQHVIFNLVNNSTQALKSKGEIKIETSQKGKNIVLEVSDTGEGIPVEIQKFIFEPFFTTKPEGEGTGLGLNIVKNIVENTNGRISYEANTPSGAKFLIEWPVYENTDN